MGLISINAGSGDCAGNDSPAFSATGTSLEMGNNSASDYKCKVWIPFVVPINRGRVIVSATLKVRAAAAAINTTCKVKIGCEAADNPSTPANWTDLTGRALSTAYTTDNNVAAWVAGTEYSFDITTAVQEILNRAGWANGNTLAVLIHDNTSTPNAARPIASEENASYAQAILEINYLTAQVISF